MIRPPHAPEGEARPTRVFVIDDHGVVREGIRRLLEREDDMEVVGEASSGTEALDALEERETDVVVLDIALGDSDGLDLIPRIARRAGRAPILILSMFDENVFAERALRAGAVGYLMKEEATQRLVEGIRTVSRGDLFVSSALQERLIRRLSGHLNGSQEGVEALTDRELQVFRLLGEGLSTRGVADRLTLSVKTIETHRAKIMEKLDLGSATHLIQRATLWVHGESGLI